MHRVSSPIVLGTYRPHTRCDLGPFQRPWAFKEAEASIPLQVYRSMASTWFEEFSDITFAGMLEMSKSFLPISPEWDEFVRGTDELFERKMGDIARSLETIAVRTLQEYTEGKASAQYLLLDLWTQLIRCLSQIMVDGDPWLRHLDWSLPKGKLRSAHAALLQDKPKWYRDCFKDGRLQISTRSVCGSVGKCKTAHADSKILLLAAPCSVPVAFTMGQRTPVV